MAILGLSLTEGFVSSPSHPDLPVDAVLHDLVRRLPPSAPIVVLVHGYKYSRARSGSDPFRYVYAPVTIDPRMRFRSWPQGLGFTRQGITDGLCLCFAWPAHKSDPLTCQKGARGPFARVYNRAEVAGAALARVVDTLHAFSPHRSVDILAHSLGARVALQAMRYARRRSFGQVILMGGAEYVAAAESCISGPAGRNAQVYNITAAENDVFDAMFRWFGPAEFRHQPALGSGLAHRARNCVDIPLDHARTPTVMARRGVTLGATPGWLNHWGFYTRHGTMSLYRDIFRQRHRWDPAGLREDYAALPDRTKSDGSGIGWFGSSVKSHTQHHVSPAPSPLP